MFPVRPGGVSGGCGGNLPQSLREASFRVVVSTGFQEAVGVRDRRSHPHERGRKGPIPSVVRSVVDHFPTMRPPAKRGFILADLNAHATSMPNIINPTNRPQNRTRCSCRLPPAAHELVVERVNSPIAYARHHLRTVSLRSRTARLDPLTTAGWTSMVFVAVGIILITIGIGYATYLLAFLDRSKGETGFLRSLGTLQRPASRSACLRASGHPARWDRSRHLGGIPDEQTLPSRRWSSFSPDDVLPPYTSITDWGFLLPMYLGILVVVLVAFATLLRATRRIDLQNDLTHGRVDQNRRESNPPNSWPRRTSLLYS